MAISFIFGSIAGIAFYHYGSGHGGLSTSMAKELKTIDFVYAAASHAQEAGLNHALKSFNTLGSRFDKDGNYVYAYVFKGKSKGVLIAHGSSGFCDGSDVTCHADSKRLIGTNLLNKTFGADGDLVKTNIAIANNGGGWVPKYCWKNPKTNKKVMKKAFVLPVPNSDVFIGSGFYTDEPC